MHHLQNGIISPSAKVSNLPACVDCNVIMNAASPLFMSFQLGMMHLYNVIDNCLPFLDNAFDNCNCNYKDNSSIT